MRAPCPVELCGLVVRLSLTIVRAELVDLAVSLIGNFRQQEQVVAVEAG